MSEQASEAFLIHKGEPKRTKEEFFRLMEQRVQRLDETSYREKAGADNHFGHVYGVVASVPEGKVIQDPTIYLNEADFHVDGEDFTDVIPVVVRHEAFELWTYAKNGWSLAPATKSYWRNRRARCRTRSGCARNGQICC